MGKALAGQIPWEYLTEVQVALAPREFGGVLLTFLISAGDATYILHLHLQHADAGWARQQAEWTVKVALQARLRMFGTVLLPIERTVIQTVMANPRPEYLNDGALGYFLPVALDGGHALTLLH